MSQTLQEDGTGCNGPAWMFPVDSEVRRNTPERLEEVGAAAGGP
jgi:hypothetical protein